MMRSLRFHGAHTKRSFCHVAPYLLVQSCFAAPYPNSEVIRGIRLDWSTHRRSAQGSDNFALTWADDDHLYGAWGDGGGFGGTNRRGRVGLGVARIEGPAASYRGFNVWGGHRPENPATFDGKSWGMTCVDGVLYMWVVPDIPEGKSYRNHYQYVQLARSTDHGATWAQSDWRFCQSEFLTIPTFLNFGKDHAGVPAELGEYVFSYFVCPQGPRIEQEGPGGVGLVVHKPGKVYLARCAKDRLFDGNRAYQFYAGTGADGEPRWRAASRKVPVFFDANGVGWCMSATYVPALRRVLLCTEHDVSCTGLLGLFDAPTPWGPWTTVRYYDRARPFGPGRQAHALPWANNVFFASLATKWLDGTRFTLNFSGAGQGQDNDSFNTVGGSFVTHRAEGEQAGPEGPGGARSR